jgi:hypothetical protein
LKNTLEISQTLENYPLLAKSIFYKKSASICEICPDKKSGKLEAKKLKT